MTDSELDNSIMLETRTVPAEGSDQPTVTTESSPVSGGRRRGKSLDPRSRKIPRRRATAATVNRAPDSETGAVYEYVDPEYLPPEGVSAKDWVRIPRRTGRVRRMIASFIVSVVAIGAVAYGAVWFVDNRLYPGDVDSEAYLTALDQGVADPTIETVDFTIEEASTLTEVASQLDAQGVVSFGPLWRIWAQRAGVDTVLAGDYTFPLNADADLVQQVLDRGPAAPTLATFNVPEGLELTQYSAEVANDLEWLNDADVFAGLISGSIQSPFLADSPDGATLEGLLFPATYEVNTEEDATSVLQRMADEMRNKTIDLNYGAAAASYDYIARPYDLLVIASLIEKEARTEVDREKISRVIHNRLVQGMPLQIDATFLYCVPDRQPGEVQAEWKNIDCPHNTYRNSGLPPTPIAAPGEASMRAAANPSPDAELDEALFYVLCDLQGNHCFAETNAEHEENIAQAIADGVLNQ